MGQTSEGKKDIVSHLVIKVIKDIVPHLVARGIFLNLTVKLHSHLKTRSSQMIRRYDPKINMEQNSVECAFSFCLVDKLTIVHHPNGKWCLLKNLELKQSPEQTNFYINVNLMRLGWSV